MLLNSRGFSLVEVIVAMLVFAGVALGAWAMFGASIHARTISADKTAAYAIANQLIETADMSVPEETAQTEGKFYVEYKVEPPKVEVEVFYDSNREKSIVKVVTARD